MIRQIQILACCLIVTKLVQCSFPSAKSTRPAIDASIKVSGSYDGKLDRFIAGKTLGDGGQKEGQKPIFVLADGSTLSNVIIGSPSADGIHCKGTCTLTNVWWEDVGEDAATFKGKKASDTMTINGGGAKKAADKVFQQNGPGTMIIKNFEVEDFGKLYRSCGNCKKKDARHVVIEGIKVKYPGKVLVGINPNFGDTAKISKVTISGDKNKKIVVCQKYKGVTKGKPVTDGSGPDSTNCIYKDSDIIYD